MIVRVGDFPESSDPRAERWYALLNEERFAELDGSILKSSSQTVSYKASW